MLWIEVGKRIADLRHDKSLTQMQFGNMLGISRQNVSRIERGEKSPGDYIPIICEKTGVSADYIYFGISPLADIAFLNEFSQTELKIGLDILKRLAELLGTVNGNDLLMKEIMRSQTTKTKS